MVLESNFITTLSLHPLINLLSSPPHTPDTSGSTSEDASSLSVDFYHVNCRPFKIIRRRVIVTMMAVEGGDGELSIENLSVKGNLSVRLNSNSNRKKLEMSDALARHWLQMVIVQLLKVQGFSSVEYHASLAFTDAAIFCLSLIVSIYSLILPRELLDLERLCRITHQYSDLACRSHATLHDLLITFADLRISVKLLSAHYFFTNSIPRITCTLSL